MGEQYICYIIFLTDKPLGSISRLNLSAPWLPMPSGRRHDSITLWTLPLVAGVTFERTGNGTLTLLLSGGYLFSGLMFGPDLDIYSRQYQRWGPLRWIWLPYRRHLRHRSFWSHGPLVGTAGRVLYLLAWLGLGGVAIALVGAIGAYFLSRLPDWHQVLQQCVNSGSQWAGQSLQQDFSHWLAVLIGLELGAISHSLSDWLGSAYYRLRRPRRARVVTPVRPTVSPMLPPPKPTNPLQRHPTAGMPPLPPPSPAVPPPQGDGLSSREPQLPAFGRWLRRPGG
jgi:uncharacterized metal-binding protein